MKKATTKGDKLESTKEYFINQTAQTVSIVIVLIFGIKKVLFCRKI
jgi:hypothetical protein